MPRQHACLGPDRPATGRDGEYTAAVPHLTAPGGRKKTDGVPNTPVVTPRPSQPAPPA